MADFFPVLTISYKPVRKAKKKSEPRATRKPNKQMQEIARKTGIASRFLPKIVAGLWWGVTKLFNEVVRLAGTEHWKLLFPSATKGVTSKDPEAPNEAPPPPKPPSDTDLKRNLSKIAKSIVDSYKGALGTPYPPSSAPGEFLRKRSGKLKKSVMSSPGRGNTHKVGYRKTPGRKQSKRALKVPFAPYKYGPMHIANNGRKGIKTVVNDLNIPATYSGRVLVWSYVSGQDEPEEE